MKTFNEYIEEKEKYCECGHKLEDHAHSQDRSNWSCEFPDCECSDFKEDLGENF